MRHPYVYQGIDRNFMVFSCYFLCIRAVKILFQKNIIPKKQATKKSEFDRGANPSPSPLLKKKKSPINKIPQNNNNNPKKARKTQPLNNFRPHKLSIITHKNLLSAIIVKPSYAHPLERLLQPSRSPSSLLPARGIKN